jgi:hypothetical protein
LTDAPSLDVLRAYAIARSLFEPTTLRRAVEARGFVQADPIRAKSMPSPRTARSRTTGAALSSATTDLLHAPGKTTLVTEQ